MEALRKLSHREGGQLRRGVWLVRRASMGRPHVHEMAQLQQGRFEVWREEGGGSRRGRRRVGWHGSVASELAVRRFALPVVVSEGDGRGAETVIRRAMYTHTHTHTHTPARQKQVTRLWWAT